MDPQAIYRSAVQSMRIGDLEAAHRHAAALVETAPEAPQAVLLLGNVLTRLERYSDAEKAYRQAIRLDPNNPELCNNLAVLLKLQGRTKEAKTVVERGVQISNERGEGVSGDLCYNYANILKLLGEHDDAIVWYRAAIERNRNLVPAYNNLGTLLEQLGRIEEAERIYREGLSVDSSHANLNYNLGIVLERTERIPEAETAFRNAIRTRPAWPDGLNNLGITLQKQGRTDESIDLFNRLIAREPTNPQAKNNLAYVYAHQGKVEEAEQLYLKAISDDPSYRRALANLGQLYEESGNYDRAVEAQSRLIEQEPDNVTHKLRFARMLIEAEQFQQAATQLKEILRSEPSNVQAHLLTGTLNLKRGRLDRAFEAYRTAQRLEPDNPEIHIHLARTHRAKGEEERAISELSYLLQHDRSHYAARLLLGELYLQRSLYREALALFRELEEEFPEDQDVLTALVRTFNGLGEQETAIQYAERLVTMQEAGGSQDDLDNLHNTLHMYEQVVNEYAHDYEEIWQRNLSALAALSEEPLEDMTLQDEESLFLDTLPDLDEDTVPIIDLGGIEPVISVREEEESIILEEMEEEIEPPPEDEHDEEPWPPGGFAGPSQPPAESQHRGVSHQEPSHPESPARGPHETGPETQPPPEPEHRRAPAPPPPSEPIPRPLPLVEPTGQPPTPTSTGGNAKPEPLHRPMPIPMPKMPAIPGVSFKAKGLKQPASIDYTRPDEHKEPEEHRPSLLKRAEELIRSASTPEKEKNEARFEPPPESDGLLDYLETLTDFLPAGRKDEPVHDEMMLRMGSLRNKLAGKRGLLRRKDLARKTESGAPREAESRPAGPDPESITRTFGFVGALSDFLPDKRIGKAIKSRLQSIVQRIRSSVHGG